MRGLKILVVAMGILLVAGVAVLVGAIALRLSHRGAALAAFTAPPIALPRGATIEAISTGADRIVLELRLPDGTRQLVVVDLASGRELGTIPLGESR